MTRLGHAEESPYRGPIRLDGDPKGASVVILGAGLAGMTAAIELERAGYKVSVLEYNLASGRAELDDPGRRRRTRARRRDTKMRVRPRPLSQSGAVAHSLSSLCDPGLLPPLRRRARAVHPAQSQRLSAFRRRVRRQAAAHPRDQGRLRRRRRRASRQGHEKGRARRCGVDGGSGNPARGAARRSARSTRTSATGSARIQRPIAAMRSIPGGGLGAEPVAGEPIGLQRHSDLAPVAGPAEFPALRFSDHDVPAGRRHGQDRRSVRAADSGSHSIRREGRRHPAERQRRDRRVRGPRRRRDGSGGEGRLVRVRDSAQHPEPDPDRLCPRP